jgi:hypothetical protein
MHLRMILTRHPPRTIQNCLAFFQPRLPGCPKSCPGRHFGMMMEGAMKITYDNGTCETINAGQPYVIAPGHLPEILGDAPAVMIEFNDTPFDELVKSSAE